MIGLTVTKKVDFLKTLNSDEAASVLKTLLEAQPDLEDMAYDIAMKVTCNVDADEIMEDVFRELNGLDVDELFARSGKTRYGYKEPSEEAWEMFEEAFKPSMYEMMKSQNRGLLSISKIYCIGIIKGLLKFERESCSEFKDWATDAPLEFIDRVIDEWRKVSPCEADVTEVILIAEVLRNNDA